MHGSHVLFLVLTSKHGIANTRFWKIKHTTALDKVNVPSVHYFPYYDGDNTRGQRPTSLFDTHTYIYIQYTNDRIVHITKKGLAFSRLSCGGTTM